MGALKDGLGGGTGVSGIEEEHSSDVLFTSTNRVYFRDAGINIRSNADGKITITSDGSGTDDITFSGTITFDDDMITPTTKKIQFRDSGLFINSGADGKMTISSDGSGADDITLSGTVTVDDNITIADAKDLIFNTTTGTKIGTGTTQKIGFFNATPVVQESAIADPASDTAANNAAIDSILASLRALGLIAT